MKFNKILKVFAFSSLLAILLLRLYAIFFTVHLHAWDDNYYRRVATMSIDKVSLIGAVKDVIIPYNHNRENWGRITNYTCWLTLAAKICPSCDRDNAFHFANFIFLLIQGMVLYALCYYATREHLFSAIFTFIYLSSPLIFGMNRWLMTENSIMVASMIYAYFPLLLVTRKPLTIKNNLSDAAIAGAIAFLLGMFSISREYSVFTVLFIVLGVILSLLVQKRYAALIAFSVVIVPYMARLYELLEIILTQTDRFDAGPEYFYPLHQWLLHFFKQGSGPVLSVLLIFIFSYSINYFIRIIPKINLASIIKWLKEDKVAILLLAHLGLTLLYITGICVSRTRTARTGLLPLVTITPFAVLLIYAIAPLKEIVTSKPFKLANILLVFFSLTILCYQLFVAFDGGKNYAVHGFDLEYYNHPLNIRPLNGEKDTHECGKNSSHGDHCPYKAIPK